MKKNITLSNDTDTKKKNRLQAYFQMAAKKSMKKRNEERI